MAYGSYADLEREAPAKPERKATPEAFAAGLSRVAPPGKKPNSSRVANFGSRMKNVGKTWLREWTESMYA